MGRKPLRDGFAGEEGVDGEAEEGVVLGGEDCEAGVGEELRGGDGAAVDEGGELAVQVEVEAGDEVGWAGVGQADQGEAPAGAEKTLALG